MLIEEILSKNEGKTLEFKEGLQSLKGILKTVVAFANTAGGIIVVGIEDKTKKVVGLSNPLAEEDRLASVINDSICPLIIPDIEIQNYCNKQLIIINVPHVSGPCYLKSAGMEKGTYIRLGSTNRVVDNETLQALKNLARNVCFDEIAYIQGKPSDLDWDAIQKLFAQVDKKITTHNAQSIGLLTQQGNKEFPSFGGIILFGINRLKLFPEAIIRCVRFAGNERDSIIDQANIEIYLPFAIEEAIKFIQRNTHLRSEIKSLSRKDIPQYPLIAIREALINAVVHADYAVKGVFISVAIFDERIEITNPGSLPFGFTLDKALAGASRIRNRVIAKVFYHLKWIEQWGRGLQLIVKECIKNGLAQPKFEELNNQFRVTLYSNKHATKHATQKKRVASKDWKEDFIKYLKNKKGISTKDSAKFWKITPRAARLRLIKLISDGIIKKTGTTSKDPSGRYVFVDKCD